MADAAVPTPPDSRCEVDIEKLDGTIQLCGQHCAAKFEVRYKNYWLWLCEDHLLKMREKKVVLPPGRDFTPSLEDFLVAEKLISEYVSLFERPPIERVPRNTETQAIRPLQRPRNDESS